MPRLKTCQACSRHVFVHETLCPFCSSECGQESRAPIFDIKAGMSRAQRFAVVAAVAGQTALVGCSAADDPSGGAGTGGVIAGMGSAAQGGAAGTAGGGVQPVYGAPIAGQAGMAGSAGNGGGMATPVYGAPIEPDAGTAGRAGSGGSAGAAGSAGTGGRGGIGGAIPAYGAPVPLYGASPPPSEEQ